MTAEISENTSNDRKMLKNENYAYGIWAGSDEKIGWQLRIIRC
jgi:hypothetical protein